MNAPDIQLNNPPLRNVFRNSLQITSLPLSQKIILRGDFTNPKILAGLQQTGLEAPATNRFTENNQAELFWLGPDELMLNLPAGSDTKAQQVLSNLTAAYQVDVSDYYHQLIITDQDKPELLRSQSAQHLLSQLFHLDLHPDDFLPGQCRQTLCKQAPVLISYHQNGKAPDCTCLRIQYRASYKDYLWQLLQS